jgi:RimJ/RimL family protein N-acetyltransferase
VVEIVAVTDRLVVRTWADEDVEALAVIGADPDVVRYLGGVPWSVADARSMIERSREIGDSLGVTSWALQDRRSGSLVGHCGFARTNAPCLRPEIIEIGWTLDRRRWGEGLATEAAKSVMPRALQLFERWRIVSKCQVENVASERVMQRLGLRRAGTIRRSTDCNVVYRLP